MLTTPQREAILHNLPRLVTDLDALDVIDFLLASSTKCLTTADYESIMSATHNKGRSAGVRCLVTCLLRRPTASSTFITLCNALRPNYNHLADQLEADLTELEKKHEIDNCDSQLPEETKSDRMKSCSLFENAGVSTSCQQIEGLPPILGCSPTVYNQLFSVINLLSSHPLAVLNCDSLLRHLSLLDTAPLQHLQPTATGDASSPFHTGVSCLRRGLCHFFTVGLTRQLESRGSPLKYTRDTDADGQERLRLKLLDNLILNELIPTLQKLDWWNLADRVKLQWRSYTNPISCTAISILEPCSLRPSYAIDSVSDCPEDILTTTKTLLHSCVAPMLNHSLVSLDWPFLLRELRVCPRCIFQFLWPFPRLYSVTAIDGAAAEPSSFTALCREALEAYYHAALTTAICQQERCRSQHAVSSCTDRNDEGFLKACVASVVHGQLLPALRALSLNALSDEVEQNALRILH
ncbi:hypothetical protein PHET_05321 [Paragonimus heterotremus]|uniref:Caspase recruitment domain-containing protein n=1 Tax=Paragonimus heterotremus TaxID=100268 RepID=A0A8J4WH03_9TREM|nr:hypothetical protein PHET_05321 [Paragonimus heterotremus]